MALEKKFVYVTSLEQWEENKNDILNEGGKWFKSIVFRKDTKEIYNRGEAFGVSSKEAQDLEDALHYNTTLGNVEMPSAVGGVAKGTKASELNGKKIDELLNMILFPEVNPTIVAPSASTKFASSFTKDAVYEVGATLPTEDNLSYDFNRGSIKVAGQTDAYRAGAASGATYSVSGKATDFTKTAFEEGTYTYTASVSHAQGDEAKTSYGNKATKDASGNAITNPLAAGSVTASSIKVYGAYAMYASSATAGTLAKQTLTTSKTNVHLTMKGGDGGQVFAVKGTCTKIYEYNSVSGKYDINKLSAYDSESVTIQDAGGNDVTYTKYTRKDKSGDNVLIEITF